MSKARNLADLLEADGDVKADNLDSVSVAFSEITSKPTTLSGYGITDAATSTQGATADSALQDVVDDTTPQLGGDLDTNGNDISFGDNDKAIFGAGDDLQIYHDGTHNRLVGTSGNLNINLPDTSELNITGSQSTAVNVDVDDAVTLYNAGSPKLATTNTGIDVTGEVQGDSLDIDGAADISGELTLHANLDMQDDDRIKLGTGDDLQIYHDGSNSYIADNGTGNLNILADNNVNILNNAGTETKAEFVTDGAVNLYYNNVKKFETTSYGVDISGSAVADTLTDTTNSGNITLDFGAYQNFVLTLTGNVTLVNPTTEKVGQSGFIIFIQDSTGSRTVSLGTDYETAGGAGLTLSTAASSVDIVPYVVQSAGNILLGAPQLAFS